MPAIVLTLRPPRRLQIVWLALATSLVGSLALAEGAPWLVRWGTAAVSLAIGWGPASDLLFHRAPDSVRAIEWRANGVWQLSGRPGSQVRARLSAGSAILGPWIFLVWVDERGRKRRAVIDAREAGPVAFRLLAGRLRLAPDGPGAATDRLVTFPS